MLSQISNNPLIAKHYMFIFCEPISIMRMKSKTSQKHIPAIDFIKGIAIIFVILLHSIPKQALESILAIFHLWQAVPLFFIIMGYNMALSFRRRGYTSLASYMEEYVYRRLKRIAPPFLAIYALSLIIGAYRGFDHSFLWIFIGRFPIDLPGNYFVSMIFQFALIFPFLWILFTKNPKLLLVLSFLLDLAFQLTAPYIAAFDNNYYLYNANILRYLSAIALGMWISKNPELFSRKNMFILAGSAMSFLYLVSVAFFSFRLPFIAYDGMWIAQNVVSFFYPVAIVLIILKIFPLIQKVPLQQCICLVGKASYHIYLTQLLILGLGFSAIYTHPISAQMSMYYVIFRNLANCIIIGLSFYLFEIWLKKKLLN